MRMWLIYILIQTTLTTKPGFRFEVTQKAIDYARLTLVPILKNAIRSADIPDISERIDTPVGHYHVYLRDARITRVDIPSSSAKLDPPASVNALVSGASISLTGKWKYREDSWPHIGDSGSVDVTASGVHISLTVKIGMTSQGEPSVRSQSCSFNVGHIRVKFHGGMAWLYNLFSGKIGDAVMSALKGQLCPLVRNELDNDVNSILSTLDLTSDIDNFCFIDYTLVQQPFVINHALFVNGKGEIFSKKSPAECPSPKQELPTTVNKNRMVTLWVTEYMLNTAGFAYQRAGYLQYNLTSDDIPDNVPISMDTSYFKYFVPSLYEAYPDEALKLWIKVTKPVTFHVDALGVSGRAEGQLIWFVDLNSTFVPAFTLDAQLDLCVNVSVHLGTSSEIYLDIITVEPYIQLRSSNIGNFSIDPLQRFLTFSRALLIPFVNGLLQGGIPLPSFQDIAFTGFDFTLEQGYIKIHTDVEYTPSIKNGENQGKNYTLFKEGEFTCRSHGISRDPWYYDLIDDLNSYMVQLSRNN